MNEWGNEAMNEWMKYWDNGVMKLSMNEAMIEWNYEWRIE